MKKFLYIFLTFSITSSAFANQPVDWQLGFQKAASETMRDIVNFHDKLLLPIIIAISVFVLFLMVYACIRFRASANPVPSKRTHNVAVEVLWTLIPCLILIVMAVPSFKILYKQDAIPKADITVKAIGYQWYWGYEYPDENIFFDSYMIETWFKAEKVGTYYGQCSELCGIKHAFMPIEVRVVTEEEYQEWLLDAKVKFAKEINEEDQFKKLASK